MKRVAGVGARGPQSALHKLRVRPDSVARCSPLANPEVYPLMHAVLALRDRLHEDGEDCRFAARAIFAIFVQSSARRAIFVSSLDALRPFATTGTTTRTEGAHLTCLR